jgi:hypothetical protein
MSNGLGPWYSKTLKSKGKIEGLSKNWWEVIVLGGWTLEKYHFCKTLSGFIA